MRIAVWHNLPDGGAKRALSCHVRGLLERGHPLEAWCPETGKTGTLQLSNLIPEHVVEYRQPCAPTRRGPLGRALAGYSDVQKRVLALDAHCRAVTVPYHPQFSRSIAHPSMIYFGASLKALTLLDNRKGYAFVGCNSNGVNAFFVRRDRKPGSIPELSAAEGFVRGTCSEYRDEHGQQRWVPEEVEQSLLAGLPLVDVSRPEEA